MRRRPDGAEHVQEALEEASESRANASQHAEQFRIRAGLMLTILAVVLAVTALFVQRSIKSEVIASTDLAATRGSLETARLLQTVDQRSAQELGTLAQLPGLSDATRSSLQQEANADQSDANQEADNASTGTGQKQLQARMAEEQVQKHTAETRADRLEYGEVVLEAALVIGSLAILLVSARMLAVSAGAAVLGVLVAATALLA